MNTISPEARNSTNLELTHFLPPLLQQHCGSTTAGKQHKPEHEGAMTQPVLLISSRIGSGVSEHQSLQSVRLSSGAALSLPMESLAATSSGFEGLEATVDRTSPGIESRTSASGPSESASDWAGEQESDSRGAEDTVPWLLANLQHGARV